MFLVTIGKKYTFQREVLFFAGKRSDFQEFHRFSKNWAKEQVSRGIFKGALSFSGGGTIFKGWRGKIFLGGATRFWGGRPPCPPCGRKPDCRPGVRTVYKFLVKTSSLIPTLPFINIYVIFQHSRLFDTLE